MLLSIDLTKINELLSTTRQNYMVNSVHMDPISLHGLNEPLAFGVFGTESLNPRPVGQRLLALRRKFIDSGAEPLDLDGLESELGERRGGSV